MRKLLLALAVVFLSISCSEQSSYEYGMINIKLSSAFSDFENVQINIESVQVLYNTQNSNSQWVDLNKVGTGKYSLQNFKNGSSVLIASSTIVQGKLLKIRLTFGTENTITTNEGTFELSLAKKYNSTIEILYNEDFEYDEDKNIVLNIDMQKSVDNLGNNKFELTPRIRTYTEGTTGAIEGIILALNSDPEIFVNIDNKQYSTYINDDGYFNISGLPEGVYELFILPQLPYIEKSVSNIQVNEGSTTNIGDIEIENNQIIARNLEGDLNITPSTSPEEIFTMTTPIGLIDINLLQNEGSDFNYTGSATEVMIMPKAQGATIVVDGQSIELDQNIRYLFKSIVAPLSVNLRNTSNGNGHWWIYLEGENISIYPIQE